MLFTTCLCITPAQRGLHAVLVPVAIPKLAGLCSARPQVRAEQWGEGSAWPRNRTGVKHGFFSLIEGLGAKFGAGGAGANQEHWAWRPQGGEFGLWGQLEIAPTCGEGLGERSLPGAGDLL